MGLFAGKKGLIFGLANKDSIAWGITKALHEAGLVKSRGEARRLIEQGGVRLNGAPVVSIDQMVQPMDGSDQFIQAGKKKFLRLVVTAQGNRN